MANILFTEECVRSTVFERILKWYECTPNVANELKILWNFIIQCDLLFDAQKSDIVFVDKRKKETKVIGIALPRGARIGKKELEKIEYYKLIKDCGKNVGNEESKCPPSSSRDTEHIKNQVWDICWRK